MTCFIGGNSHVAALKQGMALQDDIKDTMKILGFGSGAHEAESFSQIAGGRVEFSIPDYARTLQRQTAKPFFDPADVWGICQGTHDARILRQAFLRSDAAPSAIAQGGQRPLSRGVLDVYIERDQAPVRSFLTQLQATHVPLFVVSCAPVRNNGQAARMGVPLATIKYVSARARGLFCAFLARQGIAYIAPPPETMDADGFLKEEYCALVMVAGQPDPHHANPAYGALMLRRIAAHLDSLKSPA